MKQGLGRGLSSLIPNKVNKIISTKTGDAIVNVSTEDDKMGLLEINPKLIKINPLQPRKRFKQSALDDLGDSIKRYGIIQPLVVTKEDGKYELIAGERRLRASLDIGLKKVPIVIRDAQRQEKLEIALVENLQREDLNPIETALSYRKLIDEFNLTQEKLSRKVGKSRPVVTNSLRLLNLPEEVQGALIEGTILDGHGQLIAGLSTVVKQMALYRSILDNKMTLKQTWKETKRMGGTKESRIKINHKDKDKEFKIREFFGTKVQIVRNSKGGGRIIMEFYGDEDLKEMMKKIN